MPSFKDIKDLANNPIAGVVTTAIRPTPAGIAYTGANLASIAFTGKTIPQHITSSAQKAPTKPRNVVQDTIRQQKMMEGIAPQKRKKPSTKNPTFSQQYSHGGLVSHKSVSACEKSMGKPKR